MPGNVLGDLVHKALSQIYSRGVVEYKMQGDGGTILRTQSKIKYAADGYQVSEQTAFSIRIFFRIIFW